MLLCKALHNSKDSFFAGNATGSERAAAISTLIETHRLNGADPFAYLCDAPEKLPTWPDKRYRNFCLSIKSAVCNWRSVYRITRKTAVDFIP